VPHVQIGSQPARGGLGRSATMRSPSITIGLAMPGSPSSITCIPRATTCGSANTSATVLIGPAGTPFASSASARSRFLQSRIARASGERIAFIDDDVLPTPVFAAEHLRSDERHGDVVVRGAVINTESFDKLPLPVWSPRNYSANWFWTSNVSVRRARLDAVGGRFDESFSEYGWEDIELGLRLRALGTKAVFNRRAVAFHWKPAPKGTNVAGMLRQVRAQARTAVRLEALHPGWRVALAIGDTAPQRLLGDALRKSGLPARLERLVGTTSAETKLPPAKLAAARLLASAAYYDELERAKRGR